MSTKWLRSTLRDGKIVSFFLHFELGVVHDRQKLYVTITQSTKNGSGRTYTDKVRRTDWTIRLNYSTKEMWINMLIENMC